MPKVKTIVRRGFLIGSASIAGGFAFGLYKLGATAPNPLSQDKSQISLNAFVIISENGITLVAPKAEMGQGVHTTWAALIAEELDIELEQVNVIHGPPAKAYYNSALFGLALPFLDFEITEQKQEVRRFMGDGAKLIGLQLTAGSTSMRDGFVRMRMIGAQSREMLKSAAAKSFDISADKLATQKGAVIAPDGQSLRYEDLASDAAKISPPHVELREPSEWSILRKPQNRVDMLEKVTGKAVYGSDVQIEGLHYAAIRQAPTRAGKTKFDASRAKNMRGVVNILDLGEAVAVIATNSWYAMQAANAIDISWSPSTYAKTTNNLFAEIEQGFQSEPNTLARDDGNVSAETGIEEISAEYRQPLLAHTCMETMSATALFRDGQLSVWCGNQTPISTQTACAKAIGISPENVNLESLYMGGGFGRRSETDFAVLAVRIAHAMPGTPVQTQWSRKEDIRSDMYRPATIARYRGIVQNQKITLVDGQISGASVSQEAGYRSSGKRRDMQDREHVSGAYDQPYSIKNYRIRGYISPTNLPIGYWRSVSTSYNVFAFESFIDELAYHSGLDPLVMRQEMLAPIDEPSTEVVRAVGKISDWDNLKGVNIGRGVAFSYIFGTPIASVVVVQNVDGHIRINDMFIVCDVGAALDPRNISGQLTGGAVYGLSAAVMGEITLRDGKVEQSNFHDYDALRMFNTPRFHVKILENNRYIGGIGECGTAIAPPALANAVFDLTGERPRSLPLMHQFPMRK